MAQTNYPYLDLTVLPEIRQHVITSRAVLLFNEAFDAVLWSNGEGAGLLGFPTLRDLLDGPLNIKPAMQRQISAAIDQLDDQSEVSAVVRIGRLLRSRLLGFSVSRITLPNKENAVLFVTENIQGRGHDKQDMSRVAVECLDGYSHASAILGSTGELVASSKHFSDLDVSQDELTSLVKEVSGEEDRLIKRLINTADGTLAAGIARLSDNPASHILIIADASEAVADVQLASDGETSAGSEETDAGKISSVANSDAEEPNSSEAEPATPVVGAFSNRRDARSGLGRWYYKPTVTSPDGPETDTAQTAVVDDESASVQMSGPVGETNLSVDEATSELQQTETPPSPSGETTPQAEVSTESDEGSSEGGLIQETSYTVGASAAAAAADNDTEEKSSMESDSLAAEASSSSLEVTSSDAAVNADFQFSTGPKPIRFVWDVDTNNQFRSVSDEFAKAVGPKSANVVGMTWQELCDLHEIDNGDEITALLKKGDTWSGKTVLWPVEDTDLRVPIDLAGLPSYGRNRVFEGFNGFGIVRTADAVVDPNASGMKIAGSATADQPAPEPTDGEDNGQAEENVETPEPTNVVNLGTHRDPTNQRSLSSDEQETFEEIGEKLSDGTETGELTPAKTQDEPNSAAEADSSAHATEGDPPNDADGATHTSDGSNQDSNDSVAEETFTPSAFSGPSREPLNTKSPTATSAAVPDHNVDTSILARLPIPVLVYRENDLLFGNGQFFDQTGYTDLSELANAGGVEALFGDDADKDSESQSKIYHANGQQLDVQATLQRVPWDENRAMLLTLRQDSDGDGGSDSDGDGSTESPDSIGHNSNGETDQSSPGSGSTSEPTSKLAEVVPLHGTSQPIDGLVRPAFGGLEAEDLRNILDTATDGVVILTDEGIVRALNKSAEALFDVEPDAILDQSFTKILAPESHRSALDYLSGMSGTGVASLMNDGREVIGKTAKGGLIPLFMTIGKLQKTDACCAVMRDITQWKKAEEELLSAKSVAETASAQKTEFLAKVSHEIRTPLNAIIGFSDMMIEERFGKIDNDRYRGYLRDIHRSGNHVLELVNDLLDISKIEAGKMELEFDACDLNTTVSESVALTQPDANKERIIIRTSLSAVVPKVVADPRSLRQIILNLVSNSIKFTKPGGQVIVSTVYEESGEVVMRVRDTGIGMSEMELSRALKPFQQINAETDTQGTGLGLPLTKAMVEANRARFEIESQPEEGTLVEIYFPSQRVLADR